MTTTLLSLLVIMIVALAAPLIAVAIPGKPVPEVVFLLFMGAVLGPNMVGLIQIDDAVHAMSELGLAFLFLLAGYEVNVHDLAGNTGKVAAGTWFVCFALALGMVALLLGETPFSLRGLALAIACTTTAYGTLAPILKDRGLVETPVGKATTAHGVVGELFPILAIAMLLSSRASWQTLLILAFFLVVAVVLALIPARARKAGSRLFRAIEDLRDTNAQTLVRFVVVILLVLVCVCSVFDIDTVLGAFVAGFVLRAIMPEGDAVLENKLETVGYSFFIPVFFVVSGAGINLGAVFNEPAALLTVVAMLLMARTVPVYVSTFISRETRGFSVLQRLNVALYSTMALPLIVAICKVATAGGFMTDQVAGTLMTAGALTVLVMPMVTSLTRTVVDAHPIAAIHDLAAHHDPDERRRVLDAYRNLRQEARRNYIDVRDGMAPADVHDAAEVLATFNAQRLAIMADLHANELSEAAEVAQTDPEAWKVIADERRRRWEVLKARGDVAWEHIKDLGDREIDELSEHGGRLLERRARILRNAHDVLTADLPKHATKNREDDDNYSNKDKQSNK
jgi:Kef-type K+ transport system membrane component KefB